MTKNFVKFLTETSKLTKTPRTGWVLRKVKNPETIGDHVFRMTLLNWFLAKEENFDQKKVIKAALFHELCEVYAGDLTPYFWILKKEKKPKLEIFKKWILLSQKEKEKTAKKKFEIEKKSLEKLIKTLPSQLNSEIFSIWLAYEKGILKEGKFVKQADQIETLIQAIEYFGTKKGSLAEAWWHEMEEVIEHPLLHEFLKVIEKKFYLKKIKTQKDLEKILELILAFGKLKRTKIRELQISMASFSFLLAILAWIFAKKLKLDEEKMIKMALFSNWEKAISQKKLLKNLPSFLKKEIIDLLKDYKTQKTKETQILKELETLNFLLLFPKKDKKVFKKILEKELLKLKTQFLIGLAQKLC